MSTKILLTKSCGTASVRDCQRLFLIFGSLIFPCSCGCFFLVLIPIECIIHLLGHSFDVELEIAFDVPIELPHGIRHLPVLVFGLQVR